MEIDPKDLSRRDKYFLMTATVIPRPIGWTSTRSADGVTNLAPFSFFNAICSDPPIVALCVGRRRGVQKDTAANLLATREAVVHIAHRPLAEKMVQTSAEVPPDVDEFTLAGLTAVDGTKVNAPRVREAALAMETVLHDHHEVGNGPIDVFYLEVVHFHLADEFLTAEGRPDPKKLAVVGRLGGTGYCDTAQPFDIERPVLP